MTHLLNMWFSIAMFELPEVTVRISTVKIRYGMGVGLLFCMGVMYTDKKALLS